MRRVGRGTRPEGGSGDAGGWRQPDRAAELLLQVRGGLEQVAAARVRLEEQRRSLAAQFVALGGHAHGAPPGDPDGARRDQLRAEVAVLDRRLAELAEVAERLEGGAAWLASGVPAADAQPPELAAAPPHASRADTAARPHATIEQPQPQIARAAPAGRTPTTARSGRQPRDGSAGPGVPAAVAARRGWATRPWWPLAALAALLLLALVAGLRQVARERDGTASGAGMPAPDTATTEPAAARPTSPAPQAAAPPATPTPQASRLPTPTPATAQGGGARQEAGAPTATVLAPTRAQILAIQAAARSGQLEVTIDYGPGGRSTVRGAYDLGGGGEPPRVRLAFEYPAGTGAQSSELVAVGERTWERKGAGTWVPASSQDGLFEQLRSFLPAMRASDGVSIATSGGVTEFRWYDPDRDLDVRLVVDSGTATPRQLEQIGRSTGVRVAVVYSGWNAPVTIAPPPGAAAPATGRQPRRPSPGARLVPRPEADRPVA